MSDWPEDWTRQDRRPGEDRTAVYRRDQYGRPDDEPYEDLYRRAEPAGGSGGGPTPRYVRGRRRRRWPRVLGIIVLVLVVVIVGGYFYLDSRLHRVNVLTDYAGRPAASAGTNWLMVGSDSRKGMTKKQEHEFHTGYAAGQRTDTIMMMHLPSGGGEPTLVSIPRDSYVPIPGHGSNKINAAFAYGGPKLLVRTVEKVTDIRIDHYMQINFAGFIDVVDSVGGVHICNDKRMKDPKAGINIPPGCHDLKGETALGYVRSRHFANGDLQRVKDQRKFLGALMHKAASPSVLLNPFHSIPFALSATDSVAVANGDHLYNLYGVAMAMRKIGGGDGITTTVPIAGFGSSPTAGSYVRWDHTKATALFHALREDHPIPKSLRD